MGWTDHIDKQKCVDLMIGVIGINVTFLLSGVIFQSLTKLTYLNEETGKEEPFTSAVGIIGLERLLNWLMTEVWNHFTIPRENAVTMPKKKLILSGFAIFFSSITMTIAIYMVSYPLTIMVKSCNILSVILVGVLCSRVTDRELKLESNKITVAIVFSIGILMFRFFDPEANFADNKQTQLMGFVLLLISLIADGFIPDFQAELKQKYKPQPTEMMLEMNKWTFIFCLIYSIITGDFLYTWNFALTHSKFCFHIVLLALAAFFGQIFIYRMIKQFKQHIVPFVVTTRKIITVVISLIYFNHKTSILQLCGILIVFAVTTFEFLREMRKKPQETIKISDTEIKQLNQQNIEDEKSEIEKSPMNNKVQVASSRQLKVNTLEI